MSNVFFISSVRNPSGTYTHTMSPKTYELLMSCGGFMDTSAIINGQTIFRERRFGGQGFRVKTKQGNTYRVKRFGTKQ